MRPAPWILWLATAACGPFSGCAGEPPPKPTRSLPADAQGAVTTETPAKAPAASEPALPDAQPAEESPERRPSADRPRRIIYNADVDLIVDSLGAAESELMRLLKANDGYVSETELTARPETPRAATWTVRVPFEKFDAFLAAVIRLGELNKSHVDSQDVTQEYYDLGARIANKQQEEKRLQKHLADSTGKLEDILAVERELSRVRGEIEQGQGRLRYLTNQTAFSTVTVRATEVKDYTAPVSPSFGTRIGRTFRTSVELVTEFGKAAVLFGVAAVPWLPIAAVFAAVIGWLGRRRQRRVADAPRPAVRQGDR